VNLAPKVEGSETVHWLGKKTDLFAQTNCKTTQKLIYMLAVLIHSKMLLSRLNKITSSQRH